VVLCEYETGLVVIDVEHDGVELLDEDIVFVYEYFEVGLGTSVEFVGWGSDIEVVGYGDNVELVGCDIAVELVECEEDVELREYDVVVEVVG